MPLPILDDTTAAEHGSRRLFAFNGGFFWQKRLRRMLSLAGYDLRLGRPKPEDLIAVWGQSPTSGRGAAMAKRTGAGTLYVEDALLRSVLPGRAGKQPPIGLCIDHKAPHFDPSTPSDLENILSSAHLDDSAVLNRARTAIARIKAAHLSKYSGNDPTLPLPDPGYVLVIDQTRGDASVTASNGNDALFREMLVFAQEEHPGCRVLIKTHPETAQGLRAGYFGPQDESDRVKIISTPHSPWALFEGAVGVYTVSSQMGFEAIFAGHKPRVFGQPFYAGWGLTQDEFPVPRRTRTLTRSQLFAAAMILYPIWYDPHKDQLCELEDAIDALEAQTREWREDRHGWVGHGMRLWKRSPLQKMFGRYKPMRFDHLVEGARDMAWGTTYAPPNAVRIEDGFLRSRGLGAQLIPPLSLVCDDLGIYYDPRGESRLEALIETRRNLRPDQTQRVEALMVQLCTLGVSKYNLTGALPPLPEGRKILVPGQVEDDASLTFGGADIRTNAALLAQVRAQNPDAIVIYKPHPDVVAGLRKGAVPNASDWADVVVTSGDMHDLLMVIDEVWTMTSGTGFEALIRRKKVVTFGVPFYAGWGLTTDHAHCPDRRGDGLALESLVHAALIDYPRYFDPNTGLACSVEVAIMRLTSGDIVKPSLVLRNLAKLQGVFSGWSRLWR